MTAERWREVERLLHEALQLAPGDRAAFVANIVDRDLRAEVDSLLAADSAEGRSKIGVLIGEATWRLVRSASA